MPTQEERLTALERATREALVHMRDTDMAVTAMVGVVRSQGGDIKRMLETLDDLREEGANHTDMLRAHTELLNEHTALLHTILERLPAKE